MNSLNARPGIWNEFQALKRSHEENGDYECGHETKILAPTTSGPVIKIHPWKVCLEKRLEEFKIHLFSTSLRQPNKLL